MQDLTRFNKYIGQKVGSKVIKEIESQWSGTVEVDDGGARLTMFVDFNLQIQVDENNCITAFVEG